MGDPGKARDEPLDELQAFERELHSRTGQAPREFLRGQIISDGRTIKEIVTEWNLSPQSLERLIDRHSRYLRFSRWQHHWRKIAGDFYRGQLIASLAMILSIFLAFALTNHWNDLQVQEKSARERLVLLKVLQAEIFDISIAAGAASIGMRQTRNDASLRCNPQFDSLERARQRLHVKDTIWMSEKRLLLVEYDEEHSSLGVADGGTTAPGLTESIDNAYGVLADQKDGAAQLGFRGKVCREAMSLIATTFGDLEKQMAAAVDEATSVYKALLNPGTGETIGLMARYFFVWITFLSLPALAYLLITFSTRIV